MCSLNTCSNKAKYLLTYYMLPDTFINSSAGKQHLNSDECQEGSARNISALSDGVSRVSDPRQAVKNN